MIRVRDCTGVATELTSYGSAHSFCILTDATGVLIQPLRDEPKGDKPRRSLQRKSCRRGHFFVQIADGDHVFFEYAAKETSATTSSTGPLTRTSDASMTTLTRPDAPRLGAGVTPDDRSGRPRSRPRIRLRARPSRASRGSSRSTARGRASHPSTSRRYASSTFVPTSTRTSRSSKPSTRR